MLRRLLRLPQTGHMKYTPKLSIDGSVSLAVSSVWQRMHVHMVTRGTWVT